VREGRRKRAANLEKLKTMTPEMPLTDWYPLLDEEGGVTAEAFEALRHIERRQSDTEFLLVNGVSRAMMLLPELDLKATPELCEAARTFMLKSAKGSRVRPRQDPREYRGSDAESPWTGFAGSRAHGCNCDEGIAALEASVRSLPRFARSPSRAGLARRTAGEKREMMPLSDPAKTMGASVPTFLVLARGVLALHARDHGHVDRQGPGRRPR
jgi:hypothetical protein